MRAHVLTLVPLFIHSISAAIHAFTPDNNVPFWWFNHGSPIEDGLAFYALVADSPPLLPGLVTFWERWNPDNGDYFYTTNEIEYANLPTQGHWIAGAFDTFHIFRDNEPGTVALYRFYNGANHFFTVDYNEGIHAGYGSEGVAGYVYTGGTNGAVPIYRWREDKFLPFHKSRT